MTPLEKALREAVEALSEREKYGSTADGPTIEYVNSLCRQLVRIHADELLSLVGGWIPVSEQLPPCNRWIWGVSRLGGNIGPYWLTDNMDEDGIAELVVLWCPADYLPFTKRQFLMLGTRQRGELLQHMAESAREFYAPPTEDDDG